MTEAAGVLTEAGTNELEVVEFYVDDHPYAINVAKVREIVRPQKIMSVPESHPCMAGLFRNRDLVLPLVDLGKWLGASSSPDAAQAKVIVTEFNSTKVGFLVHRVSRIHRISWTALETPPEGSMIESSTALGYLRLSGGSEGERIVFLLDFEGIVSELEPKKACGDAGPDPRAELRSGRRILLAEDSALIRKTTRKKLEAAGLTVTEATNGEDAWACLEAGSPIDLVVSDIEMPRMDGHHLTKRIKQDPRFRELPVILYSSMIYEEVRRKGEALGAEAQVCKPDLNGLVAALDSVLFGCSA
ncbi:MAG: chemotaxis protein CheV [Deltaproteobacteria bacterium]|nr:chemotaxis protein CheV [Deltaproteobacteria bacterium]